MVIKKAEREMMLDGRGRSFEFNREEGEEDEQLTKSFCSKQVTDRQSSERELARIATGGADLDELGPTPM